MRIEIFGLMVKFCKKIRVIRVIRAIRGAIRGDKRKASP